MTSPAEAARAMIESYVTGDRETVERLLAANLQFTSPYDNRIDRDAYFRLCWPNHEGFESVEIVHLVESGDTAAMTYEARFDNGRAFRNTEIFRVADGLVTAIEVYFGWALPHPVASGDHNHEIGKQDHA